MYNAEIARKLRSQACNKFLARLGYRNPEQRLLAKHLREYLLSKNLTQNENNIIRAYEKVLGREFKK